MKNPENTRAVYKCLPKYIRFFGGFENPVFSPTVYKSVYNQYISVANLYTSLGILLTFAWIGYIKIPEKPIKKGGNETTTQFIYFTRVVYKRGWEVYKIYAVNKENKYITIFAQYFFIFDEKQGNFYE